MDRVYSYDYKYDAIMADHAQKQGWLTYAKGNNRVGEGYHQVDLNKSYGTSSKNPYLDTFRYACKSKKDGRYYLTNTGNDENCFSTYLSH